MAYKVERLTKEDRQRRKAEKEELRARKKAEREELRERKQREKEERRMQRQASKGDRNAADDVKKATIQNISLVPEPTPKEKRAAKRDMRRAAKMAKAMEREQVKAKKRMGKTDDVHETDIAEPEIEQEVDQAYVAEQQHSVPEPSSVPTPVEQTPPDTDPGDDPDVTVPDEEPKTRYETVVIGPKEAYIVPTSTPPDDYEKVQKLFNNLKRGTAHKRIPSFITDSDGYTTELVLGSDNRVRPMSVNLRVPDGTEQPTEIVDTADTDGSDDEEGQIQVVCPQCNRKFVPDLGGKGITIDGKLVCRDCEERLLAGSVDDDTEERTQEGVKRVVVTPTPEGQVYGPETVPDRFQTDDTLIEAEETEEYAEEPDDSEEYTEEPDDSEEYTEEDADGESEEESPEMTPKPVPTPVADPYEGLSERERRKLERGKEKEERKQREKEARENRKDKDPDPDSFGEKFRRWKLVTFDGYVKLRTLYRDEATGEFVSETTLVKRKDLPHNAVQCTGEKGIYCDDRIKDSDWYNSNHYRNMGLLEYQFTASDAALYMQSNKIDNALAVNWTQSAHRDPTKTIIMMGVVLVVAIVVVTRFM